VAARTFTEHYLRALSRSPVRLRPRAGSVGRVTTGSWRDLSVRLAVGLAFADASIVVLALPQIVGQLHTSISHVTWVIMAYNLALIAGVAAFLLMSRRAGVQIGRASCRERV